MKKLLALLLIAVILLAGCSGEGGFLRGDNAEPILDFSHDPNGFNFNHDVANHAILPPSDGVVPTAGEYDAESHTRFPSGQEFGVSAGLLTAGEWRDNDNFDDFKELLSTDWLNLTNRWKMNPANRITVKVTEPSGRPVRNAEVSLFNKEIGVLWNARTDHNGIAYVFHNIENDLQTQIKPDLIMVRHSVSYTEAEIDGDFIEVELDPVRMLPIPKSLDLMFVIDTTGSMGDELRYLQAELADVIDTVKENNAQIPTRLSVNFYRDHGDEYVLLPHDFTDNIARAINILKGQSAAGGGDWPEAMDEALINAVFEQDWAENSVKLMFLVLDAPSHNNAEAIENLHKAMSGAAEQGIRIIPIMASGNGSDYDLDVEFQIRCMAVATGGIFTFLTDHSGIGNPHSDPVIGDFEVEKLNDMLVRIISEYLT
jgi:hypothetical protein